MSEADTFATIETFDTIRAKRGAVVEIAEDLYDHMLGCVPPKYGRGCFAMGEPYSHESAGVTYYWACKRGSTFRATFGTRAEAERLLNA